MNLRIGTTPEAAGKTRIPAQVVKTCANKLLMGLLFAICLMPNFAGAEDNISHDFNRSEAEVKAITSEELSWRFHLTGEIFILNSEGDKLINVAQERREWQFEGLIDKPLESNWRFQQKGLPLIALKHKWTLGKNGQIHVEISQYESAERISSSEVKFGKLIKEDKFTLKNFAPIDWAISNDSRKVIVRLTPGIWPQEDAIDVTSLPIAGKNIVIYGRSGRVWADQVTIDDPAVYFGAVTHQGALFISFYPFKGAKLIGEAKGNRIKIKSDKLTVHLQNEMPFLPRGVKAKVYGLLKSDMKTEKLNSIRTFTSNKEEEFLKIFSK